MPVGNAHERVVPVVSLREFFRDSVDGVITRQNVDVQQETSHYVVNLLTMFARSEDFYERTPVGLGLRPLASMLSDALEASAGPDRNRALQRLGDVSLFVAGFFAHTLTHKVVDIDYYIGMGGTAYGSLSDIVRTSPRGRAVAPLFSELAEKFQLLVDVLNEVSDMAYTHSDKDILRLYELWVKTGSERAAGLLRKLGVEPSSGARSPYRH